MILGIIIGVVSTLFVIAVISLLMWWGALKHWR